MRSAFIYLLVIFIFIQPPFIFIAVGIIFIAVRLIFITVRFIFMPFRLTFKESRNRNIAGWQNRSGTRKKNGHHITAVWQDCEFCGQFTFTFRKKYYLSGK